MVLHDYASKRIFERTPEPAPAMEKNEGPLSFVIHKHAARAVHYDLRLEMEGVLKSWSVPKGPSLDPSIKRLAVMVEDHPIEYRDFEGLIPEGSYGAGSVIIWDRGSYHHPSATDERESERLLLEGVSKGNVKFVLEGEKLHGEFALVRTGKDGRSWLLLKKKDRYSGGAEVLTENWSVLSHKTLEEMLENGEKGPFRRRKKEQVRLREAGESGDLMEAPEAPMPRGMRPMLAATAAKPFDDPGWIYEVKWDGYRTIAEVRGSKVELYSRNGISFTRKFGPVAADLRTPGTDAVLDGEIVVVDDRGRPDFQALQQYPAGRKGRLVYYVFDMPYFAGHDLTNLSLLRRKELLKHVLPEGPHVRLSTHVAAEGSLFFRAAKEQGLEGIVAKEAKSAYEPGKRSRTWLKMKTRMTQDAVIAGFTEPGGSRSHLGALVLGAFENGELRYIGHAGGGFSKTVLKAVREALEPLVQEGCPFQEEPETNGPVTWVRPELVCEVGLSGWTGDGVMRQPVFLRLRGDKDAGDAVLESSDARH